MPIEVPVMGICPFCGVSTEVPHDTQEGCIEALNAEIARMRAILDQVRSVEVPGPPDDVEDVEDDTPGSDPSL
jgi:hypothetical protein